MTETLRLGYDPDFAPFTFLHAGRPSGVALELVGAMCRGADIIVTFLAGGLAERSGQLARGEIEGLACMAVTNARRGEFDFSDPYLTTGAAFFTLRGVEAPSVPAAAHGLTVATPGTGPVFAHLRDGGYPLSVLGVEGYRQAFEAVLSGAADAAALNADAGRRLSEEWFPGRFGSPKHRFMEAGLAVAMPVGSRSETLIKLNVALASLETDGSCEAVLRGAGIGIDRRPAVVE